MQYLFLDLETTGLSPDYCEILEVAAIVVDTEGPDGKWQTVNYFHEYVRPRRPIPAAITRINGISTQMVANCKNEHDVLNHFGEWIIGNGFSNLKPVAHNGKFDFRFLTERSGKDCCPSHGLFVELQSRLVDTLVIARDFVKRKLIVTEGGKAKQELLAKSFGIDYHAHNALEDTKALVMITKKMAEIDPTILR